MKFDLHIGMRHHSSKRKPYRKHCYRHTGESYFRDKQIKKTVILVVCGILYMVSSTFTGFTHLDIFVGIPNGLYWMVKNFLPSAKALSVFPVIFSTLIHTVIIAISATTAAAFTAFFAALAGSHTTSAILPLRMLIAGISSFFRNIPLPAWAILLLLSFGQSTAAGFFALFFLTTGHLTRSFIEVIDNHAGSSYTALESAGVPYLAIIFHAVLPNTLPLFISWLLYAIETNVRDSALIGILTGTGIGFLFNLYFKSFRYHEAGFIICVLMLTVLCIDVLSNTIRRILL